MDIIKLREMLEGELSTPDLAQIEDSFYEDFDSLMKALKIGAENSKERGEELEEGLYLEQLKIAEALMREIIRLRLHKLVDMVFTGSGSPGELVEEERKLFLVLKAFVEREEFWRFQVSAMEETPREEPSVSEETSSVETEPVREAYIVSVDLPSILDPHLEEYGPINAGDLVVLPRELAKVLVERGVAQRVRISV
jgi:DNA replication factor GINS